MKFVRFCKRFIRRLRCFFNGHTFVFSEFYDCPSIVHLPVWGNRMTDVSFRCTRCGMSCDFDVSHNIYKIDFVGTRLAEVAHRGKIIRRLG